MKNLKTYSKILGFILLSSLMIVSCNKKSSDTQKTELQKIEYEKVTDSVSVKYYDGKITLQYPTNGEKSYLDSVRMWIDTMLCYNIFNQEYQTEKFAIFTGNKMNAKDVAKYYMKKRMPSKKFFDQISNNMDEFGSYELDDSISVTYLGEHLTSLTFWSYSYYMGAAHGSIAMSSTVFDNQTGKQYGYDMIADTTKLKTFITEGLIKYFDVKTEQEMLERLFEHKISLPQMPPYFTKEGLTLTYLQYEIAAYAAGMPKVVIAWKDCKEILKPEFFNKIKQEIK